MITAALRNDSPPSPRFPSDRERLVKAVERGLRARRHRQQLVRWSMTAAAAAAVLVLVIGGKTILLPYSPAPLADLGKASSPALRVLSLPQRKGGAGVVVVADATVPLTEGMALPQGSRVVAPATGEVRIGAARGTTVTLEGGGDLAINQANVIQRYELRVGAVRARVAKLVPGERFIIATNDAEVEVHGTAFRVAVVPVDPACGGGTITRVSVTEGVVSVRRDGVEVRVTPGHVWPEQCNEAASVSTAAAVVTPGETAARPRARSLAARSVSSRASAPVVAEAAEAPRPSETAPEASTPTPPLTRSELAAQNDMFASAVRAKRRGQGSQAVRIFERFGREYPTSPLAESAAAQRMKVLALIDVVAASRAATEYLARYPSGFARVEARHILDGAP
jgi:hypothetical protein